MGRSGAINVQVQRNQRRLARRRWLCEQLRAARHAGCPGCRRPFNTTDRSPTVDHVVPTARGGADEESNWQVLCQLCNVRKADQMPGEMRRKPSLSARTRTSLPPVAGEREDDGRDERPAGEGRMR